jgi:hypothetical protein
MYTSGFYRFTGMNGRLIFNNTFNIITIEPESDITTSAGF